jgi:DNA-binding PadR family transcriptional regulator
MSGGAVSLQYFVLGLLAQRPMSGYDIKRFLNTLNWLIGSPSGGSLYPVLRALLQEDLVAVEVVPGLDRPPRKIYSITSAGCQALEAWIDKPAVADAPLKAFVMRLLIADSHSNAGLLAHLKGRRKQVADHRARLREGTGAPDEGLGLGQRLALGYGLALAKAELDWLDSTMEWLSQELLSEEDGQSVRVASAT